MRIDKQGKTGRRTGPSRSRDALLDAARAQFAQNGFDGATVRAIAADAGVDPALIRHFFGDKDGLFAATIELPTDLFTGVVDEFRSGTDRLGERLTRHYLGLWETEESGAILISLTRTALGHDKAMEHFRDLLMATVMRDAVPHVAGDAPALRLNLAMSALLGIAQGRYMLRTPPTADASLEHLVQAIAPTIDHYLVGDIFGSR